MINEIAEYEEYISVYNALTEIFANKKLEQEYFENILKSGVPEDAGVWNKGRLTLKERKLRVSGVLRALEILARGKLFGTNENAQRKRLSESNVQEATEYIQNWYQTVVAEHAKRFLEFCLSSPLPEAKDRAGCAEKKDEEVKDTLSKISVQKLGQKNSFFTFYSIVADAADEGPLEGTHSSIALEELAMLISLTAPKYSDNTKDYMISVFIWLYLFYRFRAEKNYQDESGYILVNLADMERWLKCRNLSGQIKKIEGEVQSNIKLLLPSAPAQTDEQSEIKAFNMMATGELVKIRFDMELLRPENFRRGGKKISGFDVWNKAIKTRMIAKHYNEATITVKDTFGSNVKRMEMFIADCRRYIKC